MPTINELYHRHGFGFLSAEDLKELVKIDRLQKCLVRCNNGRFSAAAQDVQHYVDIINASGKDSVRDISMMFNGNPPPKEAPLAKPQPLGIPSHVLTNADEREDPLTMPREQFDQWFKRVPDGPLRDSWAGRRAAVERLEQRRHEFPYLGPNGPTGHGDECYSDADPGL